MGGERGALMVLGLARSGLAAARLGASLGYRVLLVDDRAVDAAGAPPGAERIAPALASSLLAETSILVPSPGVPASHPLLARARELGVRVAAEIELAAEHIDATLVAVTGTNGKSTTVSLLGRIFEEAGFRTFAGGNLGRPLSEAAIVGLNEAAIVGSSEAAIVGLSEAAVMGSSEAAGQDFDVVVAEVSSFQLEQAAAFRPHAAALLNVTPDHLDRHGDMDRYLEAKLKLFRDMDGDDFAVFAAEAPWLERAKAGTQAKVSTFGWLSGGGGDAGVRIDAAARRLVGPGGFAVELPAAAWPLLPHDLENAAAAAELARVLEVPSGAVARAIAGFRPLRHRLAKVRELGGVSYWNDSKATNVGAVLSSLRAFDAGVVLLAGGVSKGCAFEALASEAARITLVVAYGEAAPEIEAALASKVRLRRAPDLAAALAVARREATPGAHVLLAPACASFDEFRDYVDRGERFERMVMGWEEEEAR